MKREGDRAAFFDKIRNGFGQNQQVKDYYNNLYTDLKQQELDFNHKIIDLPAQQKQREEAEKARLRDLERNRLMSNNTNFIKMQMDERDLIKRNLRDRDVIEEKYLSDKAVMDFDEKEGLKKHHMDQLRNENLVALQY